MTFSIGLPPHATLRALAEAISRLAASIAAGFHVEHGADGRHTFPWVDIPFTAARFAGGPGMTWTVDPADVAVQKYQRISTTLTVCLEVQSSTMGGVATTHVVYTLPESFVAKTRMGGPCAISDNGTAACGWWVVLPGSREARFYRHPQATANWSAAGANNTAVIAQMAFEVQ